MISVLFLDFDGVLNHREGRRRVPDGWNRLDPACVARVNEIVRRTGCRVVVSSSWRLFGEDKTDEGRTARVDEILKAHGAIFDVYGVTPCIPDDDPEIWVDRGQEIAAWLAAHPEVDGSIVILDDYADMAHLIKHLIQTDDSVGLTDAQVSLACLALAAS